MEKWKFCHICKILKQCAIIAISYSQNAILCNFPYFYWFPFPFSQLFWWVFFFFLSIIFIDFFHFPQLFFYFLFHFPTWFPFSSSYFHLLSQITTLHVVSFFFILSPSSSSNNHCLPLLLIVFAIFLFARFEFLPLWVFARFVFSSWVFVLLFTVDFSPLHRGFSSSSSPTLSFISQSSSDFW